MDRILDIFFIIIHTGLILFNVFGWLYRPLRLTNFILLILTGLSWFGLGIFYGIGYCPLTDWHFAVLERLGEKELPYSYIQYLIARLSGFYAPAGLVDKATVLVYLLTLGVSGYLNLKGYWMKKLNKKH